MVANAAATAVLLAIPVGRVFEFVEQELDATAVFGWLIFFVPLFGSAVALLGIQISASALTRPFAIIAMPGSFMVAFLALFTYWRGASDFAQVAIGVTILLGLNVLALWEPFKVQLDSSTPKSGGAHGE